MLIMGREILVIKVTVLVVIAVLVTKLMHLLWACTELGRAAISSHGH